MASFPTFKIVDFNPPERLDRIASREWQVLDSHWATCFGCNPHFAPKPRFVPPLEESILDADMQYRHLPHPKADGHFEVTITLEDKHLPAVHSRLRPSLLSMPDVEIIPPLSEMPPFAKHSKTMRQFTVRSPSQHSLLQLTSLMTPDALRGGIFSHIAEAEARMKR